MRVYTVVSWPNKEWIQVYLQHLLPPMYALSNAFALLTAGTVDKAYVAKMSFNQVVIPVSAFSCVSLIKSVALQFIHTTLYWFYTAAIDCGDPGTPTNGQRSLSSTTYNSVVTYTCDVGYTLQGSNSRTCQSDGQWSGSVPQCQCMLKGCNIGINSKTN